MFLPSIQHFTIIKTNQLKIVEIMNKNCSLLTYTNFMPSFKSNGVACPSKERLLLNRNTLRFRAYSRQKEKMAIRHFLLKHDYKLYNY